MREIDKQRLENGFSWFLIFKTIAVLVIAIGSLFLVWSFLDMDRDGSRNGKDNCVFLHNLDQLDTDHDGDGDVCDDDDDSDGVPDEKDNCPQSYNPSQKDQDRDGYGDWCDTTPYGPTHLSDC